MRILFISETIPFPPVGGGALRTFHLLRGLAAHHEVTIVGFTFGESPQPPPFPLRVISVEWEPSQSYRNMQSEDPEIANRAMDFLDRETDEPWIVSFYNSDAMADALRRATTTDFDLIIIEETELACFLPCLPSDCPKILDLHNVRSLWARRTADAAAEADRSAAKREAARTLYFEAHAVRQCALSIVCSEHEAEAARSLLGVQRVEVVPNGVDTSYYAPSADSTGPLYLLFTGTMDYVPNEEGVCHFVSEIFPIVQRHCPDAEFHIVGKDPTPKVVALCSDTVFVHGFVPDMRPFFDRAAVVVVPILSGGGTRFKILEAAASAKAIVSTTLGAEGLDFQDGRDLLLARDEKAFATATVALIRDGRRRAEMGRNARKAACAYDWRQIVPRFVRAVEDVAGV
jgi:glycosyltransferase involved in cell wall biosynthesis